MTYAPLQETTIRSAVPLDGKDRQWVTSLKENRPPIVTRQATPYLPMGPSTLGWKHFDYKVPSQPTSTTCGSTKPFIKGNTNGKVEWKHFDSRIPTTTQQQLVYSKDAQWKHYDFRVPSPPTKSEDTLSSESANSSNYIPESPSKAMSKTNASLFSSSSSINSDTTDSSSSSRRALSLPAHIKKVNSGKPLFWFLPSHRRNRRSDNGDDSTNIKGNTTSTTSQHDNNSNATIHYPHHRTSFSESCIDLSGVTAGMDLESILEDTLSTSPDARDVSCADTTASHHNMTEPPEDLHGLSLLEE
jgi:hypothetical protein